MCFKNRGTVSSKEWDPAISGLHPIITRALVTPPRRSWSKVQTDWSRHEPVIRRIDENKRQNMCWSRPRHQRWRNTSPPLIKTTHPRISSKGKKEGLKGRLRKSISPCLIPWGSSNHNDEIFHPNSLKKNPTRPPFDKHFCVPFLRNRIPPPLSVYHSIHSIRSCKSFCDMCGAGGDSIDSRSSIIIAVLFPFHVIIHRRRTPNLMLFSFQQGVNVTLLSIRPTLQYWHGILQLPQLLERHV